MGFPHALGVYAKVVYLCLGHESHDRPRFVIMHASSTPWLAFPVQAR